MLQFSRRLALVVGVVTAAFETFRRWDQLITLMVPWPWYLDDIFLGLFLVTAAWLAGRARRGRVVLAAAWGFLCGHAYGSFFQQLEAIDQPDPSGFPGAFIVALKGVGLALGIVGLATTIAARDAKQTE